MTDLAIADRLAAAREKLTVVPAAERSLPALAAAMLAALTALTLAGAVILGPGVEAPSGVEAPAASADA